MSFEDHPAPDESAPDAAPDHVAEVRASEPPLLQVSDVAVSFDGRPVLDGASLDLRDGEIVGIVGASGGGKTTLFNVIAGLVAPDRGRVLAGGADITGQTGHVAYMMQKDLLLPNRRIADNVALPLLIDGVPKREASKRAQAVLADFGLSEAADLWPSQLSGGMRQRAALARTYLFAVGREEASSQGMRAVALLDEPFSALDALTKAEMHDWYLGVMGRIRLSTLFVTHDIDEAVLLSDRVLVLAEGRIAAEVPVGRPRPRTTEFTLTDEFLAAKRAIWGFVARK